MGKEYPCFQAFGYKEMLCELAAIVRCNGAYFTYIWCKHPDYDLSQRLSVLSFRKFSGHCK